MLSIILPPFLAIFVVIALGYICTKYQFIKESESINKYAYYLAFPALLFVSMARADLNSFEVGPFVFTMLISIILPLVLIYCWHGKSGYKTAAMEGLIVTMPNVAYVSLPLILAIYGESYAAASAIAVVVYNVVAINLGIVVLETGSQLKKTLLSIAKSPVVIPPLIGLIFAITQTTVPSIIMQPSLLLAASAAPTGLFVVGIGLKQKVNKTDVVNAFNLSWLKLMLQPLICLLVGIYIFDLNDMLLRISVLMAAAPVAVASVVIAHNYKIRANISSLTLVFSVCGSVLTLLFWLWVL